MLQSAPIYAYIPARDVARARRFYAAADLLRRADSALYRSKRDGGYRVGVDGESGGTTAK
jgi:GGDEF domain-containing protein